ncbi:unnamed protein product [Brachionus calyciflorus]|uniref:VWA7 N-terminal domain-containing protein n=1 Tax=Brachionus calyciflorus TaxID=104777 RepID=A0A813P9B5_9BILA|nr:unnamed protein product [Brachionus calyciflorus]
MKLDCFLLFVILILNKQLVHSFIPASIINFLIGKVDNITQNSFGKISETLTHEEIVRRGLAKSITKFFYDQKNGSERINLNKISNDYYDYRNIYFDYYNKTICEPKVKEIMDVELGPNVALVDIDPTTKDMPYAHFDAETFNQSNNRVINFTNAVYNYLSIKNYEKARELTAQILHTIQDFYSHSNWLEMGNTNQINKLIGTSNFSTIPVVDASVNQTCESNCTLVEVPCNNYTQLMVDFLKALNLTKILDCPIKMYRCAGNLVTLDKLVSGFYTGQRLEDGTSVPKPKNMLKCSHGGLIDVDSWLVFPKGGINKDSGYYIFSPRADLHLQSANLAISHTEYYFDQIRKWIGDKEFDNFLELTYTDAELAKISNNVTCTKSIGSTIIKFKSPVLIFNCFILYFLI